MGYTSTQAERIKQHLIAQMVCLGKHRITSLISTTDGQFDDWSADYRLYSKARVDPQAFFGVIRREVAGSMEEHRPLVVAIDDTRVPKSSRKTPGVKYNRDPLGPKFRINFILAQRFLQFSAAMPMGEQGDAVTLPIGFYHAPTPIKPGKKASEQDLKAYKKACKENRVTQVAADQVHHLREQMDQDGQAQRPLCCVIDGGFTNRTFLKEIPDRCACIGRIRADAKLYYLPESQALTGRKRIYGKEAPTPEILLKDKAVDWEYYTAFAAGKRHNFKVKTLSGLRWRATGERHVLRLIVITPLGYRLHKGGKLLYRKPAYLACTDPNMSVEQALQSFLWRWKIEVNFRDEKTIFGVGDAQVRHPESVERVPSIGVAAYGLLLLAGHTTAGRGESAVKLPPPKWDPRRSQRITTQQLVSRLRAELWGLGMRLNDFGLHHLPVTKSDKLNFSLDSAILYGAAVA